MTKRCLRTLGMIAAMVVPVFGQEQRRATITGRQGNGGQCLIEVTVDGVADVEIQGDTARVHTLNGQPAMLRRFECNQPVPSRPFDLQFRGIDGRGHVGLISDPRNNGVAVVRIEDQKGGTDTYRFALQWNTGGSRPGYQGDGGGPFRPDTGGRFGRDQAIRSCGEAVRDRLQQNGYRDVRIGNTNIEDKPGHNDWIYGSTSARIGAVVNDFNFACSVDFDRGQIRSVNVNPAGGDGYRGRQDDGGRSFTKDQAIRACADAVQDRVQRDGYHDVKITGIDADDRPGRNDWIVGALLARRGPATERFDFGCSADFADGRIRSINVDRR